MARIYVAFHHDCVGNWSVPGGKVRTEIFHPQARISQEAIQEEISKYQIFLNNKRLAPSRS